ncbi:MAG: hypothetical protein L3K08_03680, partial [Thermoplasmata archaeon]|nr:hypothetical protein [Thermoplasmata archaeon]
LFSAVSVGLGVLGIGVAYLLWGNGRVYQLPEGSPAASVRTVLLNRYYVKDAADYFGLKVIYGLARVADFVDTYVIDGVIHGIERGFADLSDRMRRIQTGVVSDYAGYVAMGLAGFLVLLVWVGPWIVKAWGA